MKLIDSLYHYEHRLLQFCMVNRYQRPLTLVAKMVSRSGDGYLHLCFLILILYLDNNQGFQFFTLVVTSLLIERIFYWVLKNSIQRKRPPDILPKFKSLVCASDKFSFPSGHTSAAFLLAALSYYFYGDTATPLYIWACGVGASRVILGVHFPTDILAGAALGIFIATISFNHLI